MLGKALLLVSFIALAVISNALAYDESISISIDKTGQIDYGEADSGTGQTSSDSLLMYKEYYDLSQGEQYASGPVQFNIYGSEPTYLIIDGQSQPYDSKYVPSNSLWIQGRTSWTQYIKCPLNARFKMLAYSNGGPITMVETYPDGYQDVQQYQFYRGYTQLVFLADEIGRHTLVFYGNGQQSNEVVVDVVRGSGSSSTTSGTGAILIDSTDQGFDPTATVQGYDDPYGLPEVLIDSADGGFDPAAPLQGEMI